MKRGTALLVSVLVAGVAVGVLLLTGVDSGADTRGGAHEVGEARLAAVQDASVALVPGARLLAVRHSGVHGARSATSTGARGGVTYALAFRRRIDFADVAMEPSRGGPIEPMLALAVEQERVLTRAGFHVMQADWSTVGDEGRQPVEKPHGPMPPWLGSEFEELAGASPRKGVVYVQSSHQSDSGGGGGTTQIDLRHPQILHHRIYVVPQSGATLFVRNVLEQATGVVEVELSYSDRTVFGVDYPTGSYITGRQPGRHSVREAIVTEK